MAAHNSTRFIEERGNRYYCNFQYNGKRYRSSLGTSDPAEASLLVNELRESVRSVKKHSDPVRSAKLSENWIKNRLYRINAINKKKGEPVLSLDTLKKIYERSDGRCELTGIPFSFNDYGCKRAPYAPSFDRIDAAQGYHKQNIRMVCFVVNVALNEWGDSVLWEISKSIVTRYLPHAEISFLKTIT